jgi:Cytochrome P450
MRLELSRELVLQTSSLLTFVIYLLGLHPDVCRRLREEVVETFGPTGTPTYERLKKMDYCAFPAHILLCVTDMCDSALCSQGDPPSLPVCPPRRAHVT